jgi:hypothetical protein
MLMMANWTTWALPCTAHDPEVRLRGPAASRGITERSANGTVTDLAEAAAVLALLAGADARP